MIDSPTSDSPGAIFDMDGVLVDSHEQHERSWFMIAEELGRPMTCEMFKQSFGMRNESIIPDLFGWAEPDNEERIRELSDRKEELYRELLARDGIEPLPGALSLLEMLEAKGIPCSLGSSTSRKNVDVCLEITGLARFFGDYLTAGEDVRRGKPDPEVFLTAAKKIQRDARHCFVIEDAHVGIEAGRAAGMKTIAVTTTHPAGSFGTLPDLIVESLTELSHERIGAVFQSA